MAIHRYMSPLERIWAQMIEEPNSGCWIWLGSRNRQGYGRLKVNDRSMTAHRVLYEMNRGPIPKGLTIDHLCLNKWCVNPMHLEPVPSAVNVGRALPAKLRKHVCPHGHAFNGYQRGFRVCLTCIRARKRAAYHASHPDAPYHARRTVDARV